jgi:microcompartment protein CcmL/EutN
VGELVAIHVIPRPHANVDVTLPLGRQSSGKGSKR